MPKLDLKNFVTLVTQRHGTQAEFCDQFAFPGEPRGISRSTLHKWKKRDGEINLSTMRALLKHFDVPRHILDESAREIDEDTLLECVELVQKICKDARTKMPNEADRVFWAVKLYRQRMQGRDPEESSSDMRRSLETTLINFPDPEDQKTGEQNG
tara:strand:- start:159 stop:623 length:465 start_codon:yes stop_codon:yes gene_type:complete